MKLRWLSDRVRELAADAALRENEPELERLLVGGALVVREGDHFRIESGDESLAELEARAKRAGGLCDCGSVLSVRSTRAQCRACGREYACN